MVYWNAAQKHLFADLVYVFSLFWSRLNFSTAFSSNAVSICQNAGLTQITRLEMSARYLVQLEQKGLAISPELENKVSIQLILFLRQRSLSGMDSLKVPLPFIRWRFRLQSYLIGLGL